MLGAIIGDIVGSRWEFNPTNDYNFEWLSDENGFADDTICTGKSHVMCWRKERSPSTEGRWTGAKATGGRCWLQYRR